MEQEQRGVRVLPDTVLIVIVYTFINEGIKSSQNFKSLFVV